MTSATNLEPASKALPSKAVAKLQELLLKYGYNPGPIDGDYGPRTAEAAKQYLFETFNIKPDSYQKPKVKVLRGRMSTFGGPNDGGVKKDEGVALADTVAEFDEVRHLFVEGALYPYAKKLNPDALYIACRWDYGETPRSFLRKCAVTVRNPATGVSVQVTPIDWGPATWTNRVADLSPGAARLLGLGTDDECEVEIPLP